ncbi:MAG: hypothetical protein A2V98_23535 [Planctomycetes bacterium RBG_16_64_12]|nr:MAG: hypothetical protein A2V98_23535 [Planctomycetes bacterium RBG_16_64_12]
MSYREVRDLIVRHTRVVELGDGEGALVAICPEWQGRVMTSTCGGEDGPSFGFVNRAFIEAGKLDPRLNNYGAEDRMWLSPEGGPFSLWFKPGAEQTMENWHTPPALNEGAFKITSGRDDPYYRLARRMKCQNASGAEFDLAVTRDVRLLKASDLATLFGEAAAGLMTQGRVKMVGFETINTITNRGETMTREKGLVSIWSLGMLNASSQTVVIVPYKPGEESRLGPPAKSDYFGRIPPERLKILPEAILFLADGKGRGKIGTSQKRARNVLGSIDFQAGVLTLVQFTMPDDPTGHDYLNNMWGFEQEEPYVGDVANSYNDGPPEPGKEGLGAFYEIESLSPAVALATGESLTHHHRTLHVQADPATLGRLAQEILGVDLETVRREMFPE